MISFSFLRPALLTGPKRAMADLMATLRDSIVEIHNYDECSRRHCSWCFRVEEALADLGKVVDELERL
jgi:hypothetical protein